MVRPRGSGAFEPSERCGWGVVPWLDNASGRGRSIPCSREPPPPRTRTDLLARSFSSCTSSKPDRRFDGDCAFQAGACRAADGGDQRPVPGQVCCMGKSPKQGAGSELAMSGDAAVGQPPSCAGCSRRMNRLMQPNASLQRRQIEVSQAIARRSQEGVALRQHAQGRSRSSASEPAEDNGQTQSGRMGVIHLRSLLPNGELQALAGHLSVSDTLCTSYVLPTGKASGSEGQGRQLISFWRTQYA